MSILGVVVRVRSEHLAAVAPRLQVLPGAELALNPGDGRLVLVLEDTRIDGVTYAAAATLAAVATWPEVLNTSLVYEYSGPDAPPIGDGGVGEYVDWRSNLREWARPRTEPPTT